MNRKFFFINFFQLRCYNGTIQNLQNMNRLCFLCLSIGTFVMNLSHTISVLIRIKFDLKRCRGNVEVNMYPVSCKDDVEGKYGYGGFAQMMSW